MKNILLLVLLTTTAWAQPKTLKDFYDRATEAYKKGNYPQYYEMITGANKIHPYHQGILYEVARAAALVNKPDEAMKFLNKAIHIDADFDMANPDFKNLVNRDDFKALLKAQKDLKIPVIQSDTAFVVHDRQLHVETLAPGEVPGKFYLASVHQRKIVSVDKDGNTKDFTTSGQDGLASVLGLRIDPYRQILWACASPMDEMEQSETPGQSAVYKYDIKTKKLIKKYPLADPEMSCVFGDMCSDQKGGFYISDSKNNIIFRTNERTGITDDFFTSSQFWSIQGIALAPGGNYLFIADYIKGIFRLNVATKELIQLPWDGDGSLKSIDGLLFYKNSLIAIQNGINPMRVTRYFLNDTMDKLTSMIVIDNHHPAFNEPTNGCLIGDALYYVANSQWSGYDDSHAIKPANQLQDIVILKADLTRIK
ncbi:MAG TPA: hypothetical protein VL443_21875 [Cyclobacteriaceae bacterium]|jgi:hypothetical protein|nr:hypothetical protein [Cyclobacteriaceae bacterium]